MGLGASAAAKKPAQAEDKKAPLEGAEAAEGISAPAQASEPAKASTAASASESTAKASTAASASESTAQAAAKSGGCSTAEANLPAAVAAAEGKPAQVAEAATATAVAAEANAASSAASPEFGAAAAELVKAVEAEDWEAAERLLTERPEECNPDARTTDWDYSLMRAAAEEGAEGVCRLLVLRKADVNARDQNNMTPLMGCVVGGDYDGIVALLLEARADAAAQTDDG
eukprot:TRINITY_DN7830_c0_g1_i2.p1 TRINITY_DN7830_c0_g1~~TRINITY_DN7830_c0_g1_i2.p1  ORF type:complete len:229 (-),score=84.46 TRINITY_DN7830_c0_g1_i2:120-806(-)